MEDQDRFIMRESWTTQTLRGRGRFERRLRGSVEAHHAKLQINSTIADIFVPKKMREEMERVETRVSSSM